MALLGPSGTGKSVLLKHINGLIRPDAGKVWWTTWTSPTLSGKELAELRTQIGYVFQNGALFDSMNVFENVRLGISDESKFGDLEYCQARVAECLKLVNLPPETAEKYPAQLSGGMRKRVGIARAIAGEPKYLLYDEPTSGLDPVNADVIDALVKRLDEELGVTSVMVTHDVRGASTSPTGSRCSPRARSCCRGPRRSFANPPTRRSRRFWSGTSSRDQHFAA